MPLGESWTMFPPSRVVVTVEENRDLVVDVFGEEVRRALWTMAKNKAPDPDDFPSLFFR